MILTPLGDVAVLAYCLDEPAAVRLAAAVRHANPDWLFDVVPAYATVGVYFDPDRVALVDVLTWLRAHAPRPSTTPPTPGTLHIIPVCYAVGPDLAKVAELTRLTIEQVIELHGSIDYTVHAIGFVPGFPYLGYLPEQLCGVGRLASPRVRVEPGSVGLTGRQTGIYPLPRPGGWHLIGRTPLTIVDVEDGYFPLRVGDRVRFKRIDEAMFEKLEGQRLETSESMTFSNA